MQTCSWKVFLVQNEWLKIQEAMRNGWSRRWVLSNAPGTPGGHPQNWNGVQVVLSSAGDVPGAGKPQPAATQPSPACITHGLGVIFTLEVVENTSKEGYFATHGHYKKFESRCPSLSVTGIQPPFVSASVLRDRVSSFIQWVSENPTLYKDSSINLASTIARQRRCLHNNPVTLWQF